MQKQIDSNRCAMKNIWKLKPFGGEINSDFHSKKKSN